MTKGHDDTVAVARNELIFFANDLQEKGHMEHLLKTISAIFLIKSEHLCHFYVFGSHPKALLLLVCGTYTNVRNGESFQLPRNVTLALFWELATIHSICRWQKIWNV